MGQDEHAVHGDQVGDARPGEPAVANAGMLIAADTIDAFYLAASHRPALRAIRIRNLNWDPTTDRIVVRARVAAPIAEPLLHPAAVEIPAIEPGDGLDIPGLNLAPNFGALAQLEEAVPGSVVVEVVADGVVIAEARNQIDFLAYNQWMHKPAFHDSFAAFVLPSHPVVLAVMDRVREILHERTGQGKTPGYQGRSRLVVPMLEAIFDALKEQGFEYSDPPASFEGYGQKIRTPDVVARDHVSTCLDSAVLVASCMSAAGLEPVLVLVHGHAFAGCWTTDRYQRRRRGLPDVSVIDNVNVAQDLYAIGALHLFETTMIAKSNPATFEDAYRQNASYFDGDDVGDFEALVDVQRAIELGVRRLPVRYEDRIIVEQIARPVVDEDDVAESEDESAEDPSSKPTAGRLGTDGAPVRVRRWLDALLDLSSSNPLINLRAGMIGLEGVTANGRAARAPRGILLPVSGGILPLLEDHVVGGGSLTVSNPYQMPGRLIDGATAPQILAEFEMSHEVPYVSFEIVEANQERRAKSLRDLHGLGPINATASAQAELSADLAAAGARRFRSLMNDAAAIERESASNQLFLCIGTMVWKDPTGRPPKGGGQAAPLRSPLYLLPVRVAGGGNGSYEVRLDEGGEITPNYCLVEKLRADLQLVIPELERPDLDDSGIDVAGAISSIRRQLGDGKYAEIRIEETATLAVLDFATFRMWKDLRDNWSTFTRSPVVDHLVSRAHESFENDVEAVEGELLCPLPCDENQYEAVKWAVEGRSFVLEGPPGTGKSQTIGNIIAASMARGRRVLFVAEKQTALEAVRKRLIQSGLDPFCIMMHHETATPESIRNQLQDALDFDGVDRSREWDDLTARLRATGSRLGGYRDALVAPNAVGLSAIGAHQEVARLGAVTTVALPESAIDAIGPLRAAIRAALLDLRSTVGSNRVEPRHPWSIAGAVDPDALDRGALDAAVGRLADALAAAAGADALVDAYLDAGASEPARARLDDAIAAVTEEPLLAPDEVATVASMGWRARVETAVEAIDAFCERNAEVLAYFTRDAFTLDLGAHLAAATDAASSGMFGRKRRIAQMSALMSGIVTGEVGEPGQVVTMLQRCASIAPEARRLDEQARDIPCLALSATWDVLSSDAASVVRDRAAKLSSYAGLMASPEAAPVVAVLAGGQPASSGAIDACRTAGETWAELCRLIGATPVTTLRWQGTTALRPRIDECLARWQADAPMFLDLARWLRVIVLLQPLRNGGLDALADDILDGSQDLSDINDEFERALALTSRRERLLRPPLDRFERTAHDSEVADHRRTTEERRTLMRTVIPKGLVDARPFKPKVRLGGVGKLERELAKKVRRVSLPKLLREHGEVVTQLTPCFLMSPDAVSRLLPAEDQFFDTVIFDEASQIRVAAAIPAMGRAKAVVVVGDSRQMPPSRTFSRAGGSRDEDALLEDDNDDFVVADLESILSECRESNLPMLMLESHFRSEHEALIAFSNRSFYEGRLVTYPAPNSESEMPLEWHRIDGQFLRSTKADGADAPPVAKDLVRTNPVEAEAIVEEIVRRANDPMLGHQSMGVVTFNEQQCALISRLLQERNDPAVNSHLARSSEDGTQLFVRALERVQGDERDVILFSVAFSYQPTSGGTGRTIPLNFGPLTNAGGERRLNVAVTRARKAMVVFCSFDPQDLIRDEKKSVSTGVRMLRDFLVMTESAAAGNQAGLRAREVGDIDRARRALRDELRNAGIRVREEVGLSRFRIDLAVAFEEDPDQEDQFLALLLDGEAWAHRSTVYDREVMPDAVLRGVGWRRIGRVWTPGLVTEPGHVVSTVRAEIEREALRRELVAMLRNRGYEVSDSRDFSARGVDAAIRRPGMTEWMVAIALDGPDLFRQSWTHAGQLLDAATLRGVGCRAAHCVWAPDWIDDADAVLRAIDSAVELAEQEHPVETESVNGTGSGVTEATGARTSSGATAEPDPASDREQPFEDASGLPVLGTSETLDASDASSVALVRRAIDEIVAIEAPISEARLTSLLAARFGLGVVRKARAAALRAHFAHLERTVIELPPADPPEEARAFYWSPARTPQAWIGYRRRLEDCTVKLEEVAPEEMANFMADLVERASGVFHDELVQQTMTVFGRRRLSKAARVLVERVISWAVSTGRLEARGDEYVPRER